MLSRHSPQQIDLFIPRGNRLLPFPNITLNSGVSYTHVHTYMYVSLYVCLLPCFFISSWCFLSKFSSLVPSLSISFGPPSFSPLFFILPPPFPALSPPSQVTKGKGQTGHERRTNPEYLRLPRRSRGKARTSKDQVMEDCQLKTRVTPSVGRRAYTFKHFKKMNFAEDDLI